MSTYDAGELDTQPPSNVADGGAAVTAVVTDLPDFCWPVTITTACAPDWDSTESDGTPVYSDDDKARAVALAGQTMRMLTGYRIGGCPVTVRPSRGPCSEPTWRTHPVGGVGGVGWVPVLAGGTWLNTGCGHNDQGVVLPRPCYGVTEVRVDGEVLDPDSYLLYSDARLVRTDGQAWPAQQDVTAPDTEPGTWSVTYRPGAPVDGLGALAAGRLAGQYVRACSGGDCDLPPNVTSIARNGVSMTLGLSAFPDGKTGLREVDAYVQAVNPHGLVSAPRVLSLDVPTHRSVIR